MKKTAKLLALLLAVLFAVCLVACDNAPTGKAAYDTSVSGEGISVRMTKVKEEINSMSVSDFEPSDQQSDYVLIKVKDYGEIVLVLRRDIAPETVANFKELVANGFYTGTVFHRVIENFMIQGGGYTIFDGDFREKPADEIKGEFTSNGRINNLTHIRGVISMARVGGMNDSASSQFFIVHQTTDSTRNLNEEYATFGYVLAGMEVVDAIATCEVEGSAQSPNPVVDVVIESITFVQPK